MSLEKMSLAFSKKEEKRCYSKANVSNRIVSNQNSLIQRGKSLPTPKPKCARTRMP
jgi:hypothetical protein